MANKKISFEENLKALEETVAVLEGGNVSLDEMLELFEKGVKLTKECTKSLDAAEQKINILTRGQDGSLEETLFDVYDI